MSALWFIDNVLPLLSDIDIRFVVLGSNPTEELKAKESARVHVTGFVDAVEPYFEKSMCLVAPLVLGAGIKVKVNADGYEVLPVIISPERKKQLNQNLMMFFTGFTRFSSDVQKANAAGKQDKTAQLKEMLALVDDAERVLTDKNADLDDFGRMLDHTWRLKRQTGSAVSTNSIDDLYAKGVAAGALGGKLLGAGGGGFLVFYVQPERQDAVRWAMRDLMHIPFAFEDGGTRVIHYTPETYEPKN